MSEGSTDIFVLRLFTDGTLQWAFATGDNGSDGAVSVAVDERYGLYVAGDFEGNVPFDPAPSKVVLESQGNDSTRSPAHFSNSGRLLWAKSFGGS